MRKEKDIVTFAEIAEHIEIRQQVNRKEHLTRHYRSCYTKEAFARINHECRNMTVRYLPAYPGLIVFEVFQGLESYCTVDYIVSGHGGTLKTLYCRLQGDKEVEVFEDK